MRKFGSLLFVVGIILILGAAGASDIEAMPFGQVVAQALTGLALGAIGYVIGGLAR